MTALAQMTKGVSWKGDLRLSAVVEHFERLDELPGPKTEKLFNSILKTVEAGYWRPGERLPSEQDLTSVVPVSLGTVQSALQKLADQGVIVRRRGDGSRLADVDDTEKTDWYIRFLAEDGKTPLPTAIELLSVNEVEDTGEWSDFIGPAPTFIQISRLISVANEFKVYSRFYLDGRRFRPLLDLSPTTITRLTLRRVLHDRFNAPTFRTCQNTYFATIGEPEASHIEVEVGTLGIVLEIFGFTYRDKPICYQQFLVPPNERKISFSSK